MSQRGEALRREVERLREETARIQRRGQAVSLRLATGAPRADRRLSGRENQVLRLLSGGLTAKQVAAWLGISTNTVNYHVANVYRKLGTHNRVHAVAAFHRMTEGRWLEH